MFDAEFMRAIENYPEVRDDVLALRETIWTLTVKYVRNAQISSTIERGESTLGILYLIAVRTGGVDNLGTLMSHFGVIGLP